MKKKLVGIVLAVILAISLGVVPVSAASEQVQGDGNPLIISRLGIAQVQGQNVVVDVLVIVPQGKNPNQVALEALRQHGARPFESASLGSEGFTVTGLVWDNLPAVQNYNPADEPASLGGQGQAALVDTHNTWNSVKTSDFVISFGGTTDRRPSLVKGKGPQHFDGYNDVGWARLGGNTLGVTWYGTTTDEADMALNTRYAWSLDGGPGFDVETVFLHENGHVVGLGHSDDVLAIMYTPYQGIQQTLGDDDVEGATYLYDSNIKGSVSGIVTDSDGPIGGALVTLEGTSLEAITSQEGSYTIAGVPDPVTYDVTASKNGYESSTVSRQSVSGAVTGVDFTLVAIGGNGGGPAPVIGNISPDSASPGDRVTVTISGSDFQDGATVDFGDRITVQNVTFIDSSHLEVKIKVHPKASLGSRDVTVTNPDGQNDIEANGFTVN